MTRRTLTRVLATAGVVSGTALVARPQEVVDRLAPAFPRSKLWLARVLGVRLLAQHGAVLVSPSARVVRLASGIDLLHAASVLPFVASPRYGRAARISGGLAAAYAALGATCAPPVTGRTVGGMRHSAAHDDALRTSTLHRIGLPRHERRRVHRPPRRRPVLAHR